MLNNILIFIYALNIPIISDISLLALVFVIMNKSKFKIRKFALSSILLYSLYLVFILIYLYVGIIENVFMIQRGVILLLSFVSIAVVSNTYETNTAEEKETFLMFWIAGYIAFVALGVMFNSNEPTINSRMGLINFWNGELLPPTIGSLMVTFGVVYFYGFIKSKHFWGKLISGLLFVASVYLLLLFQSRTPLVIIGFLITSILVFSSSKIIDYILRKPTRVALFVIIAAILIGIIIQTRLYELVLIRFFELGFYSKRFFLWNYAISNIQSVKLIGFTEFSLSTYIHNVILDGFYSFGTIAGISILAIVLLSVVIVFTKMISFHRYPKKAYLFVLIILILNSMVEPILNAYFDLYFLLLFLNIQILTLEEKNGRTKEKDT